jgi:glycosyltransferase involved in cell wall biosynthesis
MSTAATTPLKVCLDARLVSGTSYGGVESVIIGLASGLAALRDGDEQYLFLAWPDHTAWLEPYLGGNARLLSAGMRPATRGSRPAWLRSLWHRVSPRLGAAAVPIPKSDGVVEASGAELMHFTKQDAFLTRLPSIYHPHDLQHLHLPQFFTPRQRQQRERLYRRFCAEAAMVTVVSRWGKQDLIRHYGLPEDRVHIVPLAPVVRAYTEPSPAELTALRNRLRLPADFLFYPAQTWPHKNHLGLVEALAILDRDHGLHPHLVFSGHRDPHSETVTRRARELGVESQLTFAGFVGSSELIGLYRLCRAVIVPSLFEAASGPLWEAFSLGIPAACSNVTSLPAQAGDAALVFDPTDAGAIATAMMRLWTDAELRRELGARGKERVSHYTWERAARHFRAHYRRLASRPMSDEDRALLAEEPRL